MKRLISGAKRLATTLTACAYAAAASAQTLTLQSVPINSSPATIAQNAINVLTGPVGYALAVGGLIWGGYELIWGGRGHHGLMRVVGGIVLVFCSGWILTNIFGGGGGFGGGLGG